MVAPPAMTSFQLVSMPANASRRSWNPSQARACRLQGCSRLFQTVFVHDRAGPGVRLYERRWGCRGFACCIFARWFFMCLDTELSALQSKSLRTRRGANRLCKNPTSACRSQAVVVTITLKPNMRASGVRSDGPMACMWTMSKFFLLRPA